MVEANTIALRSGPRRTPAEHLEEGAAETAESDFGKRTALKRKAEGDPSDSEVEDSAISHIGLHRFADCPVNPHGCGASYCPIFVDLRATASTCRTDEKRVCLIRAVAKREEIHLRPSDSFSIDS